MQDLINKIHAEGLAFSAGSSPYAPRQEIEIGFYVHRSKLGATLTFLNDQFGYAGEDE